MPLKHSDAAAHILPDDADVIRFAMTSGGREVGIDLPIAVLRAEFGASRLPPLAHFASHRAVIEATASQSYDAQTAPGDRLLMGAADFATKASRSHSAEYAAL